MFIRKITISEKDVTPLCLMKKKRKTISASKEKTPEMTKYSGRSK